LILKELVDRIQVAVLKVFVERTVDDIPAALDDCVELAARGVPKLGSELVFQERKFGNRFIGNKDDGTGHVLAVIVNAVNVEAVVRRTLPSD
jgi:hypothetical protein